MGKHLTLDERSKIEYLLHRRESFKGIGRILGKSHTTISREIRSRSIPSNKSAPFRVANRCLYRKGCEKTKVCTNPKVVCKHTRCTFCIHCNSVCPDFKEEHCGRLKKPPYVCNGCDEESRCTLRKRYYFAKKAQDAYKQTLISSREGLNITVDELEKLDRFLSPLIMKGQAINHIFANNQNEFQVCQKTLYTYINKGILQARRIDMPRSVRFRPRRNKSVERKIDPQCRVNRTYKDFTTYVGSNPDIAVVETDTVEGKKGGSVLLTIHFTTSSFMLAFHRERNTAQSVINIFTHLYQVLGKELFQQLFPLVLGDNGSEFSNPTAIEHIANSEEKVTFFFYCDPSAPYQKGCIENNHSMLRRIIPKGINLDQYDQNDINLALNHINSYSRNKLSNKTPYETFRFFHGQEVMDRLGAKLIPPNEIILLPKLLRKMK